MYIIHSENICIEKDNINRLHFSIFLQDIFKQPDITLLVGNLLQKLFHSQRSRLYQLKEKLNQNGWEVDSVTRRKKNENVLKSLMWYLVVDILLHNSMKC